MKAGARYFFREIADIERFGAGMLAFIKRQLIERGPQFVQIDDAHDHRSLPQNALQHVWYSDIQRAGLMTKVEARRYCKLHFGVPLLRSGENEEAMRFREFWDRALKHRLSYEEKLVAMDYVPVTSLMTREQMTDYLDSVQRHFAHQGVQLEGREHGFTG